MADRLFLTPIKEIRCSAGYFVAMLKTDAGNPAMTLFDDRRDAGVALAAELTRYRGRDDVVILALPRGGVPVAYEVARSLGAPLDVMIVRKLGVPGQEELALGALASGGIRVLNHGIIRALGIDEGDIEAAARREQHEIERREHTYRGDRPPPELAGRVVIVIDDGVATGATMRAAVAALRQREPARLIVAVPTAASDSCDRLRREADEVVCLATPEPYIAVGRWYRHFDQTGDNEVRELLAKAAHPASDAGS
jgi:predicted phosphoribosyltransferase